MKKHSGLRWSSTKWLLCCLVLVCGCTPIAGGPPPTRLAANNLYDVGIAHTTALQLPSADYGSQIFLEEALWIRKSIGEKSEIHFTTGIFWGGGFSYYGVLGFRRYLWSSEYRTVGIEARIGGPYYAELGFPMHRQLGDSSLWLTTHPSVGLNGFGFVHLPLGLSWEINDSVQLNLSAGSRFWSENAPLLQMNGGVSFPF